MGSKCFQTRHIKRSGHYTNPYTYVLLRIIGPISALDADVISIETSRSHGELITSLQQNPYDKGIGLGVYDIHSPRVPSREEMLAIMQDSLQVLGEQQFWVNPDCGLKTRKEQETVAALSNMVQAAKTLRQQIEQPLTK